MVDIFAEYFGECSEQRIKEHYVIVYEVHVHVCDFNSIPGMLHYNSIMHS